MGGREFEVLVKEVLSSLELQDVKLTSFTSDEGIDITAKERNKIGDVITYGIECKNYPKGTVGRPVIQKLDSAINSKNIDKGIVVTSGVFSRAAKEYARSVRIQLIDGVRLTKLARSAKLSTKAPIKLTGKSFPISPISKIKSVFQQYLKDRGFNESDALRIEKIELLLKPSFKIDYEIESYWERGDGTVIAHIPFHEDLIFLVACPEHEDIYEGELLDNVSEISQMGSLPNGIEIKKKNSTIAEKRVRKIALREIRNKYQKTVTYVAGSRTWTKTCTPRKKDVEITAVERVYLPFWQLRILASKSKYEIKIIDVSSPELFASEMDACYQCDSEASRICKDCGQVSCVKHSNQCNVCEGLVCGSCTELRGSKLLIFKNSLCSKCAKEFDSGKVELKRTEYSLNPLNNLKSKEILRQQIALFAVFQTSLFLDPSLTFLLGAAALGYGLLTDKVEKSSYTRLVASTLLLCLIFSSIFLWI